MRPGAQAGETVTLRDKGAEVVRMMFNNNRGADAPKAGERMRELLGQVAKA